MIAKKHWLGWRQPPASESQDEKQKANVDEMQAKRT